MLVYFNKLTCYPESNLQHVNENLDGKTMNRHRGISLLESILALTIIASISMMAVRYYMVTIRDTRVNHAITLIKKLTKSSYTWLQNQHQADFTGQTDNDKISLQKLITDQLANQKTDSINPWGGTVSLTPATDATYVKITLNNIPQPACKNLTQQLHYINHSTAQETCAKKSSNQFIGEF